MVKIDKNRGGNCLDLFRLLACLEVMIGHMSIHLDLSVPKVIDWPLDLFIGVPIFFILSGFLIWKSLDNTADFKRYFSKRILRLYPELWVCLFVEIISIVLFYKEHVPMSDYVVFTITQGTIFQFYTPESLKEYGCGTPNGSLWTINIIVQFYVMIFLIRKWLNKKDVRIWGAVLLVSIIIGVCSPIVSRQIPGIVGKLFMQTIFPYFWLFFLGCSIQMFKNRVLDHLIRYWWVYFLLYVIDASLGFDLYVTKYPVIGSVLLAMFMVGFAYRYSKINVGKDISYGIYIYHMIFVNMVIECGYTNNWFAFIITLVVTTLFAYCSTIFVGGYSKKLKNKVVVA